MILRIEAIPKNRGGLFNFKYDIRANPTRMSPAELGPVTCKNCQTTFEGKFCPNCSQKADTHRFTVAHFGHELFHSFTHTDKGALLLMKELLYRPGKVAFEYNSGQRKRYFNPITFLLIITAIQIFVMKKTEIYTEFQKVMQQAGQQVTKTEAEKKIFEKNMQDSKEGMSIVQENNKAFTLLIIPFLAFFSWLLFRKSGHNYAENLVLYVLITSGMTLLFFITAVIPFLLFPSLVWLWIGLNFIALIAYNIIAFKQFFNQSWGKTLLKGIAMIVVMMIFSQLLTAGMAKLL